LVQALVKRGLVTSDQVHSAQQYGLEHQRDLRQSILELNLISSELLNLLAIASQRLVRKVCPYCRVTFAADEKVLLGLELDPDEHRDLRLHRGLGCPACFQTGYMGRTGIFEIMMVGEELRDLIFQQIPKDVLRRVAVDLGMRTLKQSAVDKILDGTTTVEEVYRVVSF